METILQDVRYSLRSLLKRRGFAAVAILTLALGIGGNTAVFSLVYSVLLEPLPYPDQGRLVALFEHDENRAIGAEGRAGVAYQNFVDWREAAQSFESMAAYTETAASLTGGELPERIFGTSVTSGFFSTLGIMPAHGRPFIDSEHELGGDDAVILSDALWRRQLGGDASIVGQRIVMNGVGRTVVGIMPAGSEFPSTGVEFWVPFALDPENGPSRGEHWFRGVARLAPGVPLSTASAEMDAISARLAAEYPETNAGDGAMVIPLRGSLNDPATRLGLWTLLGVVAFVLLIACANLANLLLARASNRSREIAVRAALGAGRARLIGQLMVESMVVALAGGALGLGIAYGGLPIIVRTLTNLASGTIPGLDAAGVNAVVLVFTLAVTLITGTLVGLVPALSGTRTNLVGSLKEGTAGGGTSGGRSRLRASLVVAEVALSLVLLTGAGLMVKSFLNVQRVDPGFQTANLLTMRVSPPGARYEGGAAVIEFYRSIEERIAGLPSVAGVSIVNTVPVGGSRWSSDSWTIEGRPPWEAGQEPSAGWLSVTPDYLKTMGIPLLRGRFLDSRDVDGAPPVLVINETFARRYWPDSDPIGQRLMWWGTLREIVGIAGDVYHRGPLTDVVPEAFLSHAQVPVRTMDVLVRTAADPRELFPSVRSAIWSVDSSLPLFAVATLEENLGASISGPRVLANLLTGFAAMAALLAAIGIYGVMAYSVSSRTREIGVRLALGADSGRVLKMVVGSGLALAGIGVALGIVGAAALTRLIASLLYGVSPLDPVTFGGVALLLLGTSALASFLPARRASRVDPVLALRQE